MNSSRAIKQRMVDEKEKMHQMYHQQNLSLTDIGEHYGCSRQYVQLVFKELGISRRPRILALKNRPRRRKSKYNFNDSDDQFIVENYQEMTDPKIAEHLNKPLKAIIYRRLIVLGKKKVTRRNFTDNENEFILKNYKNMTDNAIAGALKRSLISVTHHRNRILNCPKRDNKSYSDSENNFIMENYKKMTDSQIAKTLNRSKASIAIHRNEVLGLSKSQKRRSKQKKR